MANMFETVILKMRETGMYQFLLPFFLSMAIFYGLLRKSKIFGNPSEVVSINAVVAIVASFMVWSAPILLGINVEQQLASFFVHGMTATLVVLVGLLVVSMFFPPDLPGELSKRLNTPKWAAAFLIFGGLIATAVLLSSGLINVFLPEGMQFTGAEITDDLIAEIGVLVLLLGTVLMLVWGGGGESSG